jgi:agmatine/peptidylarginine deiminase
MLPLRHFLLAGLLAGPVVAQEPSPANEESPDRTLIVLAAPSASDPYYRSLRKEILAFDVAYAKSILGRDNVVVLGDRKTLRELAKDLPADILLEAPMRDIWMRDFSAVIPDRPVLFHYSAAAQDGQQDDADWVQAGFVRFSRRHGLEFQRAPWILDGGNVVDNGHDKAIVTDRFLADNQLDRTQASAILREQLGVEQVAILPADPEDTLAHADGMAMFLATNTVAVTSYGGHFQKAIRQELRRAFPGVRIVEIKSGFDPQAWDPNFGSAKGIYVNAAVTDRHIYLPIYGTETDAKARDQIRAATNREVVPIDASQIGQMGGSVRCLSAQMKGENARRLIEAARKH